MMRTFGIPTVNGKFSSFKCSQMILRKVHIKKRALSKWNSCIKRAPYYTQINGKLSHLIVLRFNALNFPALSTPATGSSAVRIVHKGEPSFSLKEIGRVTCNCRSRFGRKDHMTRHAKKTHANFYDSSERLERTRLISTPLPGDCHNFF